MYQMAELDGHRLRFGPIVDQVKLPFLSTLPKLGQDRSPSHHVGEGFVAQGCQ
jgi:hypothetical protein